MEDVSESERKEAQRAALLDEVSRVAKSARAESGTPTVAEDALVLQAVARVRKLEEEIGHLKRHMHDT